MQKYPSGTIHRRPFPNTIEICTSLPYGILKVETASVLATKLAKISCQASSGWKRFQVKPATLLIPIALLFFLCLVEDFTVPGIEGAVTGD
jgi:hypothetical protein